MNSEDDHARELLLVTLYKKAGATVATAESCTGGLIASRITSVPGASSVFAGGVVCYANTVKRDLLGVPQTILDVVGAVSAECAEAMAAGVRERLKADVAVSVTGVAGPDGGTPSKPVGLVYLGLATASGTRSERRLFSGTREQIRRQAADRALDWLASAIA